MHVTTPGRAIEGTVQVGLGARIRDLRLGAGLSLRELGQRLGISASAMSQIERGVMQPSVNRLLAIVTALDVPLARVFEEAGIASPPKSPSTSSYVLARAGDVAPVSLVGGVLYTRLSPSEIPDVDFFESTYPPGSSGDANHQLITHHGYEIGTVRHGALLITFDEAEVMLSAGDSITFACDIPHHLSNIGTVDAVATWLIVHPVARAQQQVGTRPPNG